MENKNSFQVKLTVIFGQVYQEDEHGIPKNLVKVRVVEEITGNHEGEEVKKTIYEAKMNAMTASEEIVLHMFNHNPQLFKIIEE